MTRERAIEILQKRKAEYLDEWVDFNGTAEAYDMAIEALEQEPKREIELLNNFNLSKRAKWIYKQEQYQTAICSNCFKVTIQEKWGVELRYYDYCPNCGARMESDTE